MNITKFGQCCLLIEIQGKRILTDPGKFSVGQNEVKDIDLILITHEHADHFHSESMKTILANNPSAQVVTNTAVSKLLQELHIHHEVLEGTACGEKAGIQLEAHDGKHAEIFEEFGQVQNTGYFIENTLFYPGDAYTEPGKMVPVLALPVAGPWCKVSEAIAYAIRVRPETAFPVHDYLLNHDGVTLTHNIVGSQLKEHGIAFIPLLQDETKEF